MSEDLAAEYWKEAAERRALAGGTKEQRIEYQTRSFPVEESLSARIDQDDPGLIDDLVAIARTAPDDDALGLFGAGLVWEVLYNGSDDNAERLEAAGKADPRFLEALKAGFAGWDGIKPETKKRLRPLIEG